MTVEGVERRNVGDVKVGYDLETAHGYHERVALMPRDFVKLCQVRGEKNAVSPELKADILHEGLLYPIDVARIDRVLLAEYIEFVNKVWKSETTIENFDDLVQIDGYYYLIIAGHSRHQAITELEDDGLLAPQPIVANVHHVAGIDDIMRIQIGENIHSTPARERRATALVELFYWGLAEGKWGDQTEFLSANGNEDIAESFLSDAIYFASLPPSFRDFVFSKHMAYAVGVELGKTAAVVRRTTIKLAELDGGKLGEFSDELDTIVERELMLLRNDIVKGGMNSIAATKYLKKLRATMTHDSARARQNEQLNISWASPRELLDDIIREQRARLAGFRRDATNVPLVRVEALLHANAALVDGDDRLALDGELQSAAERARRRLGVDVSLGGVASGDTVAVGAVATESLF